MGIVVQKFGGTSVADPDRIRTAAAKAIATRVAGHEVVVVVSAMGKTTDELETLARRIHDQPPKREMDQLLATGEQITIALMAMAIHAAGQESISFTGPQIGLKTDDAHTKARIREIDSAKIHHELDAGRIVVVAGFQGISDTGAITTLGRGGSNASLVALAAALGADVAENFTDVDGIFTADPRIVKGARKLDRISYDEMLELSSAGAGVLQTRAVEFAKKHDVVIHVRNSQTDLPGTLVGPETPDMEHIVVSGAALKRNLIRVTLNQVQDTPGIAARIFGDIAAAGIVVDDIIQTVNDDNTADISFTVEDADLHEVRPVIDRLKNRIGGAAHYRDDLCKVSVVGVGMRSHTGVARLMFESLADAKINIENITTSEIKISVVIRKEDGPKALQIVHDAFELEKDPAERAIQ